MILRRLVEYADTRMDLPPPMYGETPVRWTIRLKPDGELEGFVRLGGEDKATRRGIPLLVPTVVRAAGIKPKLLVDNGEYVLGVGREGADSKKVAERHRRFVELTRRCASETGEPDVQTVADFLDAWEAEEHEGLLPEDFDPQDNVAFRVGVRDPTESQSVKDFWAGSTASDRASSAMCLITGQIGPIVERLPVKVKGLTGIGGQAAGTSLVSANAPAFESYGFTASETSPISRDAGERFGKALNHLLADEKSRVYIGPSAYVFWTREESAFDPILMIKPDAESVRLLFQSPVSGRERPEVGANDFYALALSASGGRAVVRDWLATTVPAAEENLREWFRAQRMVSTRGEEADPLGLYALAASAYRDANKEMTPQIPAALVRAAIKGGRLPEDLIARAVRRNRSEGDVTRPRAALMKLVMTYGGGEGARMAERLEQLDRESKDAAYNCGRLLAELEALQRAAIPGVKATIVDRYYGAASSAPASVFGTLMRGHTAHIGKIRKERPGVGSAIQDRIGEITTNIGAAFPTTLSMRKQAIFALGYYHQRAHNRAGAKAAREATANRDGGES